MFLPNRSYDEEKKQRQKIYQELEDKCNSLITSDEIKSACMITIQEVVCNTPECSPVDTVITFVFESGSQGMVAIPLEPKLITMDILKDYFPPMDVFEQWKNGEDVEWPPPMYDDGADDPIVLRFDVGTKVICRIGPESWEPGVITKLWYREGNWPEGAFAPYQIQLVNGQKIFAPFDTDQVIKLQPEMTAPPDSATE